MRRLTILAAACTLALAAQAGTAHAEQFAFSFGDGRVNIGQFKGEQIVDPENPGLLASLTGSIDPASGEFTAPAAGLFVPPKTFENYSAAFMNVDVIVEFRALGPIRGNLDLATGDLDTRELDVEGVVSVYNAGAAGNEASLVARCSASPVSAPLDSTGSLVDDSDPLNPVSYDAAPFDPAGAAVTTWSDLPPTTAVGGPFAAFVCPMIDEMAAGPGGLWLAGQVEVGPDPAGPGETVTPVGAGPAPAQAPAAHKRCKKGQKRVAGKCRKRKKSS